MGAESHQKVMRLHTDFSTRRLENYVNLAVNGYLFLNQGQIRQQKD